MAAIFRGRDDVIAKLLPGGDHRLAHLSDEELLANTRRLVGKSNQLLAELLAHLAEVEARGVHRTRRCASLYTYCIYELRFSEDAAARRSAAARLVKQFPPLFDAIANGELHLTGLLMIGPHLTPENHVAVLGRAKFRTKKELGKLVRDLNPLPQLPDRIEPLGPEPLRAARNPTWEQYVTSLAPPVRELPPGERPGDWVKEVDVANELDGRACGAGFAAVEGLAAGADFTAVEGSVGIAEVESLGGAPSANGEWISTGDYEQPTASDRFPVGPGPRDLPPVTGPQHYQVQFSTVEEHAQLVERAKALLARTRPGVTLGELHLEAMRLLVASLEKRKFAVPDRINPGSARPTIEIDVRGANEATQPRRRGDDDGSDITPSKGHDRKYGHAHNATVTPRKRRDDNEGCTTPRPRGDGDDDDDETNTTPARAATETSGVSPTPPLRRASTAASTKMAMTTGATPPERATTDNPGTTRAPPQLRASAATSTKATRGRAGTTTTTTKAAPNRASATTTGAQPE